MRYFTAIYAFLRVLGGLCTHFHAFFPPIMWLHIVHTISVSYHKFLASKTRSKWSRGLEYTENRAEKRISSSCFNLSTLELCVTILQVYKDSNKYFQHLTVAGTQGRGSRKGPTEHFSARNSQARPADLHFGAADRVRKRYQIHLFPQQHFLHLNYSGYNNHIIYLCMYIAL